MPEIRSAAAILAVLALLSACSVLDGLGRDRAAVPPPVEPPVTEAQLALGHLAAVEQLALAGEGEHAALIAKARMAAEANPGSTNRLRLSLLLSLPGSTAGDAATARGTLYELLAEEPPTLLPAEMQLARIALRHLDARQALEAETQRLRAAASRAERDRSREFNRRLEAQTTEIARLQGELDEARAKLEAVAALERSLAERKPAPGPPP